MKGVFNQQQHQEEVKGLMDGKFKQFQIFPIDLGALQVPTKILPASAFGNPQGLFEIEGCGIVAMPWYMTNDGTILTSTTDYPAFIRFNHGHAPWLPIGAPKTGLWFDNGNIFNVPTAYALTFGRFWISLGNPPNSLKGAGRPLPVAGSFLYLMVVRGVSIGPADFAFGPEIRTYLPPTWQSLRPEA